MGYNKYCLFKDEEGDKEGMQRLMKLNELEMETEINNRQQQCAIREEMILFKYDKEFKEYEAMIQANPLWAKRAN